MADSVARHRADWEVEHAYATRAVNCGSWFERDILLSLFFLSCARSSVIFIFFVIFLPSYLVYQYALLCQESSCGVGG